MKSPRAGQAGYTIIEVMIFLVISGALLTSALLLFNGKINRTQFTQAVQGLDTRIKTAANQAATGTYPQSNFSCSAASGAPVTVALGTGEQGSRSDCIFVGKIIAPSASCSAPLTSTTCTSIDIYSVIGRRLNDSHQLSTGLTGTDGAKPRVVLDPDLTETVDLGYGTRITGIYQPTAIFPLMASGLGFFQSAGASYSNGYLNSSAQNIENWVIRDLAKVPYSPLSKSDLNDRLVKENMNHLAGTSVVYVCLKGGTGQYASIEITGANGAVVTNTQIGGSRCRNGS